MNLLSKGIAEGLAVGKACNVLIIACNQGSIGIQQECQIQTVGSVATVWIIDIATITLPMTEINRFGLSVGSNLIGYSAWLG